MAKTWRRLFCVSTVCLLICFIFIHPAISDESANDKIPLNQYGIRSTNPYVVDRFIDENGKTIDKVIVPGPPHPPVGFVQARVTNIPAPNIAAGINILNNVPALQWSFGCSPTAAAMMMGYYDNTGYPNMYTGPTNGGVFPMTNAVWGFHDFGNGDGGMALCPLSATRKGLDGRTTRGHVDDYWIKGGNVGPDPFIAGPWIEHTQGESTGDYMGTNQSSVNNTDGSTTFWIYPRGDRMYDVPDLDPSSRDGNHGLKLFVESRGYSVQPSGMFYQLLLGLGDDPTLGFTYANFKAEIDAGRPVLIHVTGHTMLGYGYNDTGSTIYIHDTFDYDNHSMTWGGDYYGMQHGAVTVLRLTEYADMGIAIAGSPSSVIIGNNVTYSITVTNNGPYGTTNANVTVVLPAGVTYVSSSASLGTSIIDGTVGFYMGTMNKSATATASLVVKTTAANAALALTAIAASQLADLTPATATSYITVNNPVPAISSLSPASAEPGGAAFTLTVNGSNFVSGASVYWNAYPLVTTFVSSSKLTAWIPAADIKTAGTALVTVHNPAPSAGSSTPSTFAIGKCFIATAAFGTPQAGQVEILRKFRDRYLLTNALGQNFVAWYYRNGPVAANYIEDKPLIKAATRMALYPLIGFSFLLISGYLPFVTVGLLLSALLILRFRQKKLVVV